MKFFQRLTLLCMMLCVSTAAPQANAQERVETLLQQMTLEEKVGQLNMLGIQDTPTGPVIDQGTLSHLPEGTVGSILGAYGFEQTRALQQHLVTQSRLQIPLLFAFDVIHGFRTVFPVPLAEASAWDPDLAQRTARAAAIEATANGVHWTFAPMVDIARDPRWGRVVESSGEDPFLGAALASAKVQGFHGAGPHDTSFMLTTAKHFVSYGAAEGGRDYNVADVSERTLQEVHLPPFRAAVAAGVDAVMPSFNEIAGTPLHSNTALLTGVLRNQWRFAGLIVSDFNAIWELSQHGIADVPNDTARLAFNAGVDVDMASQMYRRYLRNVLVVGSLATDAEATIGPWATAAHPEDSVTVLQGIRQAVSPGTKVVYLAGASPISNALDDLVEVQQAAQQAEVVIAVLGERADQSGEARSRTDLGLPGAQDMLLRALLDTGKPVVIVLMNGRPLVFSRTVRQAPALLETWFLGSEMGNAVADVLFGDINPSGKLPVTFPRNVGQIPLYYAHKNTGRPSTGAGGYESGYIDELWTPLYPFGFGLSYTSFSYSTPRITAERLASTESVTVQVSVTNTGQRAGDEIVQLYLRDDVASVTRPVRQLRGFRKIHLAPGETRSVNFNLGPQDFALLDQQFSSVIEAGTFTVFVGGDSTTTLQTRFEVTDSRELSASGQSERPTHDR
jgi:beta-glucosidase-like glycosyl hydrolase